MGSSSSESKFLYRLASDLLKRFGNDLQHVAIVFNNKRPQLFLKKYLAEISGKPVWSPHFYTIQQFFAESASMVTASQLKQFFVLLSEYNKLLSKEGKAKVSADVFYPLAEIIVSDFSQIDYYLADPAKVFNLIGSIAELQHQFPNFDEEQLEFMKSFWGSFSPERQSDIQEKFIEMWHRMPALYQNFHAALAEQKLMTSARMYRNLAEGVNCNPGFIDQFSHIVFAGFNALSKAEELLFSKWQDEGRCSFYFDADEHYYENQLQEAGHFIRRNIKSIGLQNQFEIDSNRINDPEKVITVVQTLGKVAQGKILPSLVSDGILGNRADSRAIILADEGLLLPVLQTLKDEDLNITMGYPFEQSAVYGLCDLWLDIQEQIASAEGKSIAYQSVLTYIFNPLVAVEPEIRNALHAQILEQKKAQFSLAELRLGGQKSALIFSEYVNPMDSIKKLGSLLLIISGQVSEIRKLESLLIAEAVKTLNVLSDSFEELMKDNSVGELNAGFVMKTIRRALAGLSVPFDGEPLSGLQVMGLLESRCLDFDELIVLGMNEGVLPKVSVTASFIPDNVRRAFGLPVLENQNSIFAYFFYRLLHQAKKITLVYNGISDETGVSEESRFIKQLEFETSCQFNYVLQQNQSVEYAGSQSITIEKTGLVLEMLNKYLKRGTSAKYEKRISASAFTDYINCPLKFFYSKIAGLKEPNDLPDQIGPHMVGTMVHDVMEQFYTDFIGKEISSDEIRQRMNRIPAMCELAMRRMMNLDQANPLHKQTALQQILIRVIEQYVIKVLEHDASIAPFVIRELEEKESYTTLLSIQVEGVEQQVRLMGIIDRVDVHNGKVRIVDYKTGKDKLKFKDFEGLFAEEGKSQNKALLQTLFYTYVYEQCRSVQAVEPHLYTVKNFGSGTLFSQDGRGVDFVLQDENLANFKRDFVERMKEKLSELFNPSIPFTQTKNTESCTYCTFKNICRR